MATYLEMLKQIEMLKSQAERHRRQELRSLIRTLRKQIIDYGITAKDLGFEDKRRVESAQKSSPKSGLRNREKSKKYAVAPKYADGTGNTWSGRGRKPKWLIKAISEGNSLESFSLKS